MVKYAILGPVELTDGERLSHIGGPRQVALLASLLVHANRVVSSDRLIDTLWNEQDPAVAVKSLHVAVSRLRKTLGGAGMGSPLRTVTGGYLLAVAPGELDAELFQMRMEDGRCALQGGDAKRARGVLAEALGMWRGSALAEVGYREFAQAEIRRLEELRLVAWEAWVDAGLQLTEHAAVIAELESLIVTHPGRERLAAQLMLALYRCARQADALDVYARTRAYLSSQLGLEPGPALRSLQAEILAQSPALQPDEPSSVGPQQVLSFREAMPTRTTRSERGRRVRFRLPLAAAHFTGREAELDAIGAALGVAERAVVTQAITGLGGVGKSQLAVRYVHEHADEYDIVAWIRAEDGGIADLSELAADFGLPVAGLTPAERAARAVRWLSGCDERWLLVLDNVAVSEQLPVCCPSAGHGRVIVTTRNRGMARFGSALRVDVFDEATAVEYLLRISGRAEDRDGAGRLARALGFLPLALSHAGAYCAAGTSFDDYLELLGALPAAELFDSHPEASYEQTVASTWQVSIQAAEREAPLARQVLAVAAHLAPDAIPRELFDVLLEDAGVAAGRKRLLDAFNALHGLSLAEVDDDAISVHRLLQKTIRDDARQRGDATAAAGALAAVANAFPSDHGGPQTWPRCERLLPHALAIEAALMSPGKEGQRLVALLNRASDYLLRADKRTRAVDVASRAWTCAHRLLGGEHPATLRAGANLGLSYGEAGRFAEAIELGTRVLADCERILGPDHPYKLGARAHLVRSYAEAGRTTDAIELGELALADSERIFGPDHPYTLRAGIGLVYAYGMAGRTTQAIELGEPVLADCERILGPQHPGTLRAGIVLVLSYGMAGRMREAIEHGERMFPDFERILGPEHLETLLARGVLAFCYGDAGRTTEAIELGEPVLANCERILGSDHPYTLRAGICLVFSYGMAGRTAEAIELGKAVLADCERILRPEHPFTLFAGVVLAFSYGQAGRTAEAIELGERALADCERILGCDHPNTLRGRAYLARSYRAAGRTVEAIELGEQVPADHEGILDHLSARDAS